MHGNLLASTVMVFSFWWVILSFKALIGDGPITWSPAIFIGSLSISAMSVVWGLTFAVGIFLLIRYFSIAQLVGAKNRGIAVSLGPFPESRKTIPRIKRVTPWQEHTQTWIKMHGASHPAHVKLLEAISEIIDAHPLHPASVEPGGHGDRTLLEHSHNVTEFMIKLSASYEYKGLKDPKSSQPVVIKDPLYQFRHTDPLIPLVGLVHDIGKIDCYKVTNDGVAIELRKQHDWRGRYLLTNIAEFWGLPEIDRSVLLDTVGFYHHSWDLPINVGDRPRALIDLVLMADNAAGEYEAKYPRMATQEDVYLMVKRMLLARGDDPMSAALPDRSIPYESEISGVQLSLHQSRVLYFFEEMLSQPDSVNGADPDKRIGIKVGNIIYCDEETVRERLGKLLLAKRLVDSTKGDGQKILTTRLMEVLLLRGSLINVLDDHEFGPGRCIFKLTTKSIKEKPPKEYIWPAVFLINADAYPEKGFDKIDDASLEIVSVTPIFPWSQARQKITPKTAAIKPKKSTAMITSKPPDEPPQATDEDEMAIPVQVDDGIAHSGHIEDESDLPFDSLLETEAQYESTSHNDHSGGVSKSVFEMGNHAEASAIDSVLDSAMAIPEKAAPGPKSKKRDLRRVAKLTNDASSPVDTKSWWEADGGKKVTNQLLELMRSGDVEIKNRDINGVNYGLTKLLPAMEFMSIPAEGEAKVKTLLNTDPMFIFITTGQNQSFIGVAQNTLDNP